MCTSSNPVGVPVIAAGLVTGANNAGGRVTIEASVDAVPGIRVPVRNTASVVTPTPIATIDVQPTSVTINLRTSSGTIVSITPRDAAGNALVGRAGSINVTSDNPGVATALSDGTIRAFSAGTAWITYQAYDVNQQPQGTPTTITVTVIQQ